MARSKESGAAGTGKNGHTARDSNFGESERAGTQRLSSPTSSAVGPGARPPRVNRYQGGLRDWPVRGVHHSGRRRVGEELHDAGGAGGGSGRRNHRGTLRYGFDDRTAERILGTPWRPVRLLHARHDSLVDGSSEAQRGSGRGGDPAVDRWEFVPLRSVSTCGYRGTEFGEVRGGECAVRAGGEGDGGIRGTRRFDQAP